MIGLGLTELCVKVESSLWERLGVRAIVKVEIEGIHFLLAFVGNGDARMLLKRHEEKRVQSFVAADGEKFGFPPMVFAEAEAKKITQRSFDTRSCFVVPVDSQHKFLEVVGLGTRNGDPDVRQHAGAVSI